MNYKYAIAVVAVLLGLCGLLASTAGRAAAPVPPPRAQSANSGFSITQEFVNAEGFGLKAISPDGDRAILSGFVPISPHCEGAVYEFDRISGQWQTSPAMVITPPPPATSNCGFFGTGVAITADGSTLVTAQTGPVFGPGYFSYVYIYTRVNGAWSNLPVATIDNPGAGKTASDCFATGNIPGFVLSGDGSTLLISDPCLHPAGKPLSSTIYAYEQVAGVWNTTPVAVFPSQGTPFTDNFGGAGALSYDGNVALFGGALQTNTGQLISAVYVFEKTNGVWQDAPTIILKAPPASRGQYDVFGTSPQLSADGKTALIGAFAPTMGEAYVYSAAGGTWSPEPVAVFIDPSDAAGDGFGLTTALSADGLTALVAAPMGNANAPEQHPSSGGRRTYDSRVYVYTQSNGQWDDTPTATLFEPGYQTDQYANNFGYTLALSADGTTALIGDPQIGELTSSNSPPSYAGPGVVYALTTSDNWRDAPTPPEPTPAPTPPPKSSSGGGAFGLWALAALCLLLLSRRRLLEHGVSRFSE